MAKHIPPILAGLFYLIVFFMIPLNAPLFPADYSLVINDTRGSLLRAYLNSRQQWHLLYRDTKKLPEKLVTSVLTYEDRRFYVHPGVNVPALFRAFYQNISSGKRISGASTITMQLTRLMAPKERTLVNKIGEILQALKIDALYSKEQILRKYLNHAPYGGNIVGFRTASLRYFGKEPDLLTWAEAATLAVLPNSPGLFSPGNNYSLLTEKRNRLLQSLYEQKYIDKETLDLAVIEPIRDEGASFLVGAPHFAELVRRKIPQGIFEVTSTIDKTIQRQAEDIVSTHSAYLANFGIPNISVLVVETESGKIRGYVGSQDFFDNSHNGQVDGISRPHSTGSILKPFLYALAMDDSLVTPHSYVKDIPTHYGAFSPKNYNKKYNGVVTVHEALTRSLNVPAVRILYTYGLDRFYQFLKLAGLSTLFRTADDYGLPLILGGAEANLIDIALLFRGLSRMGRFSPLYYIEDSDQTGVDRRLSRLDEDKILISPGASFLTLEILKDLTRPGIEHFWEHFQSSNPVAWKTGTSYGQRDAWAVGTTPKWTVVVWTGDFTGKGNANLTGSKCSGPIMLDIFNSLSAGQAQNWFEPETDSLEIINLCTESGFKATEYCPEVMYSGVPRNNKPVTQCEYHRALYITRDDKYQVCSRCWEPGEYQKSIKLFYPPEVMQYLRGKGHILESIPPHKPDCPQAAGKDDILAIVYPEQYSNLWIPRDLSGKKERIALRAAHRERDRTIYWYLNTEYLGETVEHHVKAVSVPPGEYILEILDDRGNRDSVKFTVATKK